MNCKPGDLAVVVRPWNECSCHLGAIVRVLTARQSSTGLFWNLESPLHNCFHYYEPRWNLCVVRDEVLKPIEGLPKEEEFVQKETV